MARKLFFKSSDPLSIGVELEFQIIDPITYGLISRAKDLIRLISNSGYNDRIKPEITQSMIEINSSVHHSLFELYDELIDMRNFLLHEADILGVKFAGGGTHPFQKWSLQKIFPTKRFKNLSRQYRYLSQRSTVFGQHVHVGCRSPDDALYLTHAFTRFVPHLLTLAASSPFYQGIDTGYHSSRSTVFNSFPLSGVMPYLRNWEEFSDYFYKMRKLGIIKTMKDFYWDIRPKPEFGTIEIRVCDTPLTIRKAVMIAAYIQVVAHFLLAERPIKMTPDLYYIYNYNRFQASRYGFEGDFIDPENLQHKLIVDDMMQVIDLLKPHADSLQTSKILDEITLTVANRQNDSVHLRQIEKQVHSLPQVVREQVLLWCQD